MHDFHHYKDLANYELSIFWSKLFHLSNHIKEILTLDQVHDKIYEVRVFNQFVKFNHKG